MTETRQESNEKNREIDPSCLCLQQFDIFSSWSICNNRKRKLCRSADICLKTFVKPHQVNVFFGGKSSLETTVRATQAASAVAVQWRNCALDTKNSWKQVGGRQTEAVAFLGRRCSLWRAQRSQKSYCAITLKGRWLMALQQQIVGSSRRLLMGMARLKWTTPVHTTDKKKKISWNGWNNWTAFCDLTVKASLQKKIDLIHRKHREIIDSRTALLWFDEKNNLSCTQFNFRCVNRFPVRTISCRNYFVK